MADDLVERLRDSATGPDSVYSNVSNKLLREAADRIEALERELAEARKALEPFADEFARLDSLCLGGGDLVLSGIGNVRVSDFRRAAAIRKKGEGE